MTLRWLPEPYQAYGGFAADGIKKVLGRPRLDPLVVLVREAVQNSWDARAGTAPVTFSLSHRTLDPAARKKIRQEIFESKSPQGTGIADALTSSTASILMVSDRGTTGLTGPMRADIAVAPGVDDRFVKMVFNVGQPTESEQRGGTYGFGKTISYVVSTAGATVIRTRTTVGSRLQERLIGVALGKQYTQNGRRYTGRHWWGAVNESGVEPVIGPAARFFAEMLGLENFGVGETGTDIAVLTPDYGGRDPAEALQYMADALAWYFWPKMIGEARRPAPMKFSVDLDGEPVAIPDPVLTPPLDGYIEALQAIRRAARGRPAEAGSSLTTVREIRSERPKRRLGHLAVIPVLPVAGATGAGPDDGFGSAPVASEVHHVACMRQPELVVEYVPGPWNASSGVQWAAVFKCASDLDSAFADAEPPTHDTWNPQLVVDRSKKSAVKVAKRRIIDELSELFEARLAASTTNSMSAVVIADALRGLIAHTSGTGASRGTGSGSGGSASGGVRRSVTVNGSGRHNRSVGDEGHLETWFEFAVKRPEDTPVTITAVPYVATDDGVELDAPAGTTPPWIIGFESPEGDRWDGSDTLEVTVDEGDTWWVGVGSDFDVAVSVDLDVAVQEK